MEFAPDNSVMCHSSFINDLSCEHTYKGESLVPVDGYPCVIGEFPYD